MFAWHNVPWLLSLVVAGSLLVVFSYYAVRGLTRPSAAHGGPRAAEILEERYARGEISAEEGRETLAATRRQQSEQ